MYIKCYVCLTCLSQDWYSVFGPLNFGYKEWDAIYDCGKYWSVPAALHMSMLVNELDEGLVIKIHKIHDIAHMNTYHDIGKI